MSFQSELLLTLYEALQITALLPTLFIIVFLIVSLRAKADTWVPALYFCSLAASFMLPLIPRFEWTGVLVNSALVFMESVQPALCFLLIIQLLTRQHPRWYYWLILLLPVIGGSSLIYAATLTREDVCIAEDVCTDPISFKMLYQVFSASVIFLLLVMQFSKITIEERRGDLAHKHRYWIVVALISLSLLLLVFDLSYLAGNLRLGEVLLAKTIIRITFIYLVLTSLFRVYEKKPHVMSPEDKPVDPAQLTGIVRVMESEKLYREMKCNRKMLAERAGISEHSLSRVINRHFEKNISEYVNSYRVEEAKQRLCDEDTSITVIAFEVGFSSIASFNRVFRDMVGCSPTEYRATQKKSA